MFNTSNSIKIYHIIHINRLESVLFDGYIFSDAQMSQRTNMGYSIGMNKIKQRRLEKHLASFPDLTVGQCVPFYFCPRSVMLYVISRKNNPDLSYSEGQDKVIHLVFDLNEVLAWAKNNNLRTCFTTSNAGSSYFDDYSDCSRIPSIIDWNSVNSSYWSDKDIREKKQSEFLVENRLLISLIEYIGVYDAQSLDKVQNMLSNYKISPVVKQRKDWYY